MAARFAYSGSESLVAGAQLEVAAAAAVVVAGAVVLAQAVA